MYAYFLLRRKRKARHQDASKRIRKQTIVLTLWGHMSECSPLLCRHTTRHHTGGEQATSSPIRYNPYCAVFSIHNITIDETTHLKYRAFVKNGTKVKDRAVVRGYTACFTVYCISTDTMFCVKTIVSRQPSCMRDTISFNPKNYT